MSEGKRLFVGLRVSLATANALARAVDTLGRRARDSGIDAKWVPAASYHVTLAFLGWTRVDAVAAVVDALEKVAIGARGFTFKTARIGAFSSLEKANVVWGGVEDTSGALAELETKVRGAMEGIGYRPEARPFHPHVTIARLRETRSVRELVLPVAEQMFGESRIDAVTLFESETKPSGSVYKEISRIVFKPPGSDAERQTRALQLGAQHESGEAGDTDDGWPRGHH